jgi:hypothetical protein
MTAARASSARSARLLKSKSFVITCLKQQIAAHRSSIKKQRQTITDLEDEFELSHDLIANRSESLPADIIFGDLCHNRNTNPHGRRNSFKTLASSREIHGLSPVAYATAIAVIYGGSLRRIPESCEGCRLRIAERYGLCVSSGCFPFRFAK